MHAIYACVRCVAAPVCAWLDGTERISGAVRGKALPSVRRSETKDIHAWVGARRPDNYFRGQDRSQIRECSASTYAIHISEHRCHACDSLIYSIAYHIIR